MLQGNENVMVWNGAGESSDGLTIFFILKTEVGLL